VGLYITFWDLLFEYTIMCAGLSKGIVGTGVFLVLFCSLGLFGVGIYTALGSTLRVKDNYLLIMIFVCASLLFVAAILGLLTLFGENQTIAILYAMALIGIIGLEIYLAVIFLGGTAKDMAPNTVWKDLPPDVQRALETEMNCCGFDGPPADGHCASGSKPTCHAKFKDALYRDRYIISYSMIGAAVIQLINIIFVGFIAGRYYQKKAHKMRNKTLLEDAREVRRL
jgi:hypothetical protein